MLAVASTDADKHGPVRAEVKSTAVLNSKSLALGGHIDRRTKRRIDSRSRWQSTRSSELKKKISKNFFGRQMAASADAADAPKRRFHVAVFVHEGGFVRGRFLPKRLSACCGVQVLH